jgi:hypothetical protein
MMSYLCMLAEEGNDEEEACIELAAPPKAIIPRQKQLSEYFNQRVANAREEAEKQREAVTAHREANKAKGSGKKRGPGKASASEQAARGMARWLDGAERQDKQAATEGKIITVVPPARPGARSRKVVVHTSN